MTTPCCPLAKSRKAIFVRTTPVKLQKPEICLGIGIDPGMVGNRKKAAWRRNNCTAESAK
jgi:hypothetical protein